jgi:hypothetical protein
MNDRLGSPASLYLAMLCIAAAEAEADGLLARVTIPDATLFAFIYESRERSDDALPPLVRIGTQRIGELRGFGRSGAHSAIAIPVGDKADEARASHHLCAIDGFFRGVEPIRRHQQQAHFRHTQARR